MDPKEEDPWGGVMQYWASSDDDEEETEPKMQLNNEDNSSGYFGKSGHLSTLVKDFLKKFLLLFKRHKYCILLLFLFCIVQIMKRCKEKKDIKQ